EADHAEGAAGQLESVEVLLARLDGLADLLVGPFEVARKVPGLAELPAGDDQAGNDQFLDRVGIGARRVEDRDAARAHLRDGNVVDAGAGAADGLERRRNVERVHVGRADEDGVGVLYVGTDVIAIGRQPGQTGTGNVVEDEDVVHADSLPARRPACRRAMVTRRAPRGGAAPGRDY